jgi:hypothetical protein
MCMWKHITKWDNCFIKKAFRSSCLGISESGKSTYLSPWTTYPQFMNVLVKNCMVDTILWEKELKCFVWACAIWLLKITTFAFKKCFILNWIDKSFTGILHFMFCVWHTLFHHILKLTLKSFFTFVFADDGSVYLYIITRVTPDALKMSPSSVLHVIWCLCLLESPCIPTIAQAMCSGGKCMTSSLL